MILECPHCSKKLVVNDNSAGTVKCPNCRREFMVGKKEDTQCPSCYHMMSVTAVDYLHFECEHCGKRSMYQDGSLVKKPGKIRFLALAAIGATIMIKHAASQSEPNYCPGVLFLLLLPFGYHLVYARFRRKPDSVEASIYVSLEEQRIAAEARRIAAKQEAVNYLRKANPIVVIAAFVALADGNMNVVESGYIVKMAEMVDPGWRSRLGITSFAAEQVLSKSEYLDLPILNTHLAYLANNTFYPDKLVLLQLLVELARLDGTMNAEELSAFVTVAKGLRVREEDWLWIAGETRRTAGGEGGHPSMNLTRAYAILGCPKEASFEEVRRQYREMCKRYHPDLATTSGERKHREELFKVIQEAYEIIEAHFSNN